MFSIPILYLQKDLINTDMNSQLSYESDCPMLHIREGSVTISLTFLAAKLHTQ